ncbi:MAG: AcrR family transcriptional regulator [Zhongshania sp.]|jgi:AcrR family transcriptional regulator
MQKRRTRLLAEARTLLARGGYEALSLRELAKAAGLTVPTIYNLIGNKDEVLLELGSDVLKEVEARVKSVYRDDPLSLATVTVLESTKLFAEDEDLYRSAFLAVEWLSQRPRHHAQAVEILNWASKVFAEGFLACSSAGLLRGRIPIDVMGAHMMRCFRTNCREWAFGICDLAELSHLALVDLYTTLAADADEELHLQITEKLEKLITNNKKGHKYGARNASRDIEIINS